MSLLLLKACNVAAFALDMVGNASAGKGIRALSEAYDHVGLPAGPAFSIWGIIFTWELVFLASQFFVSDFDDMLGTLTPCFCAGQLLQGLWVVVFTRTDLNRVGNGGDTWFWISTVLLLATPLTFMPMVAALSETTGPAYWLSFGITINAAWVLLAAGLTVNQAARAVGLVGASLSAVAVLVLAATVALELWLTGLVGSNPLHSPPAFLPVATWALGWVAFNLKNTEENAHKQRILPLYGSQFILGYRWSSMALAVLFVALEIKVCTM
jgi:hypothetical protein